ncbi:MAG: NifU family protein [Sorangiineae bacterium]|nr:NifU family protein [Polyangiaceae bacterium]MEB2323799.1 NifU family protein [Sorangiineae bacterium]
MSSPADPVLQVIHEVLGPLVRADGGELYLVRADAEEVALHLAGRFAGCPGNTLATRRVIEPALQSAAPCARIVITSGAILPPGARRVDPDAPR